MDFLNWMPIFNPAWLVQEPFGPEYEVSTSYRIELSSGLPDDPTCLRDVFDSAASCNNDSFRLTFFPWTVIVGPLSVTWLLVYNMDAT